MEMTHILRHTDGNDVRHVAVLIYVTRQSDGNDVSYEVV